jgi:hypothetical protein
MKYMVGWGPSLWWPARLPSTASEQRFYWYLNLLADAKFNLAFMSSTYSILLFWNITLSKSLIQQQHQMYAKGLKNAVCKQHEILEYQMGWSFCGHFSVIRYLFKSRVFYWKMSFPEQHVRKHVCTNSTKLHCLLLMTIVWTCVTMSSTKYN